MLTEVAFGNCNCICGLHAAVFFRNFAPQTHSQGQGDPSAER
jgi:hypothetical protein